MDLETEVSEVGRFTVLALRGEIDLQTAPMLNQCFEQLAANRKNVVVDLSNVAFLDSSALGAFVAAHHSLDAAGATLALAGPSRHLTRILALTRIDQVLAVYSSVDAAIASSDAGIAPMPSESIGDQSAQAPAPNDL